MPKSTRIEAGLLRAAVVLNSCTIAIHYALIKVVIGQRRAGVVDAAHRGAGAGLKGAISRFNITHSHAKIDTYRGRVAQGHCM
jgi:hypothetical protein